MALTLESASLYGVSQAKVLKCSYTWDIEKFSFCSEKNGEHLESPTFSFKANDMVLKCSIFMYPKGQSADSSEYLSLYLRLHSSKEGNCNIKCTFSLLNIKQEKENTTDQRVMNVFISQSYYSFLYFDKFITLQRLQNEAHNLLPEDKLTILCEVAVNVGRVNVCLDEAFPVKAPKFVSELSDDICKMFKDMTLSDVTLMADGKEIQAHKFILAARSPVFAAMFQHQMEEQKSNHVYITDIDHEVLTEMLQFMYTDNAPNLDKMAGDLLAAADKYALNSLKVLCGEALYKSITVETAAETLVLADLHSAEWLKARTIAFISTRHATKVMSTAAWKSMIPAHPHLVAEVAQALAIQHK